MSDVDDFFAEQYDRMNMPDEPFKDYVARMVAVVNRDIRLPQTTRKTPAPVREEEDQARASSVKNYSVDASSKKNVTASPSHEGPSILTRRKNEYDSPEAPVTKKQKRDQNTAASSSAGKQQTTFKPADSQHNAFSEDRPNPARVGSRQPSTSKKSTGDDHGHSQSSAFMEHARSAHNSASVSVMHSSNQGLRHSQLDAAAVPSLKVGETSKTPSSPSGANDQTTASHPTSHEPGTSPSSRRLKSNFAPQATSTPNPELPPKPTQKVPNHLDARKGEQSINTTPAKVLLDNSTTAIRPPQPSSSFIPPLTSNPSNMTSGLSSRLAGPSPKDTHDNVDSAVISSHSSADERSVRDLSTTTGISEFVPQSTSTQLPASPAGLASIQSKVSNFSRSKAASKRDRVIKITPKHKVDVETSNVTTPNATRITSIQSTSNVGIPSSVPPRGDSKAKPVAGRDKKPATSKSKKKEKELVTPLAYAQILCNKLDVIAKKTGFLKGKRLFYTGGDMQYASQSTKKKMELIIHNGGILVLDYDSRLVTHVVTDAAERPTLRALGLKSLKDVNTPIVTWSWVTEGRGRAGLTEKEHAAFPSHIVDTVSRAKIENASSGEISRISQFTQDNPRPAPAASHSSPAPVSRPVSPRNHDNTHNFLPEQASSASELAQVHESHDVHDPLAEFYDLAKAERDNDYTEYEGGATDNDEQSDDGETDDEYHGEAGPPIKRGFTCDSKVSRLEGSKNQDIIEKLQELMELHKSKPSKDDFWRGFSYTKSIGPIRNHPRRIRSYAEARSIRGVGHKTAEKIMEIIHTGGLRRIAFENTDDVEAAKKFTGIYGVGQTIAYRWYASGCRTLDDVRNGKGGVKLTLAMEIGLRFYDDINSRMPRGEAEEIFKLIKPIALELDPKLFIEIMGSFRRGKKDCGDIDIMITRPTDDNKTHAGIIPRLLHALREAGIITDDLALPDDLHAPEAIYRGLCKLPDTVDNEEKTVPRLRRRIDILSIPWQNRGAALLYYTGDDIFNRAMRFKANKMGYSLNQRGLFQGVVRDPHDRRIKTNPGTIIASETEEEIFKILGVPWQEPHERVRSL